MNAVQTSVFKMTNGMIPVVASFVLVSWGSAALAEHSGEAFDMFQTRCIALVVNEDKTALDGLNQLPAQDAARLLGSIGLGGDMTLYRVWTRPAANYLLLTVDGRDDFCQLIGSRVEFAPFKQAFDAWRAEFGADFRVDGPLEIASREVGSTTEQSAAVFMAKPLAQGAFVQVHVQYRPDVFDGYASAIAIWTPEISSDARALFPGD